MDGYLGHRAGGTPSRYKECEKNPLKNKLLSKLRKTVLPHAKDHTIDTITSTRHKLLQWEKGRRQWHTLTRRNLHSTQNLTHTVPIYSKESHIRATPSCKHSPKPCQLADNNNFFDSHQATMDASARALKTGLKTGMRMPHLEGGRQSQRIDKEEGQQHLRGQRRICKARSRPLLRWSIYGSTLRSVAVRSGS